MLPDYQNQDKFRYAVFAYKPAQNNALMLGRLADAAYIQTFGLKKKMHSWVSNKEIPVTLILRATRNITGSAARKHIECVNLNPRRTAVSIVKVGEQMLWDYGPNYK